MRRKFYFSCSLSLLALIALATSARAQSAPSTNLGGLEAALGTRRAQPAEPDEAVLSEEKAGTNGASAADQGFFLPLTQTPQIYAGHALLAAMAGYDTALRNFAGRTSADATLLPMLAVRLDFEHGKGMGSDDRFGVGARVRLLEQSAHGIDGSLGLAYQPNDFRQEGQIVGSILLGRDLGRLRLFGNVLFGGDAEGDDQAGEARASLLYRVLPKLHVGFDSRFRLNTSQDAKRAGTQTTDWQLQATPTACFALGPLALLGQAGLSMVQTTGPFGAPLERTVVDAGVVAMAGAGGAF
jgi:hypothetical protein